MYSNPTWFDILYWIGIIFFSFFGVYLLLIVLPTSLSFGWVGYNGLNAKSSKEGLEIFSKRKGKISFYKWDEIEEIKTIFHPPIIYPQIVLKNGDTIDLETSNYQILQRDIEQFEIDLKIKNSMEFK